jgi:uncharacterized repeat protein (TIGR01451 family)
VANIDADPDFEVVLGTINRGLVAYDLQNSAGACVLWGTGRGSFGRSGLAPDVAPSRGSLDGSYKTAVPLTPAAGTNVSYTIRLLNGGSALSGVRITDTLPAEGSLIGSVGVSSGQVAVNGSRITWRGEVGAAQGVTVTYALRLDAGLASGLSVTNTVQLNDGSGALLTRKATVIVGGRQVALPFLRR